MAVALGAAGAKVAVLGRNEQRGGERARIIEESGGTAVFQAVDSLDLDSLRQARDIVNEKLGPTTVLVNAAGGNHPDATLPPGSDFCQLPLEAWQTVFDLNLAGSVLLPSQVFGETMLAEQQGSIINIASMAGMLPLSRVVAYSAAKSAVYQSALEAGKHVLLEKPMAITLEDCDAIVQTAESQGCLLAVDHELRLSSMWKKVKDLIDDGFIGTPQYCLVELSRRPYRPGADGWRFDIERVGNWILEEPIHFFDLARWYLEKAGTPQIIYAQANSRQEGHPELHDNFSALMTLDSGAYAVITQTLSAFEHHQTAKVTGTRGALWASWSGAKDRTLHPEFKLRAFNQEQDEVLDLTPDRITGEVFELQDQIATMVAAVQHGMPLHATGDDGRWSVAMCIAAQQSVDSGQTATIVH